MRNFLAVKCAVKDLLKNHKNLQLKIHTKKKTYVCEVCNKAFSEKSYPNKHISIHNKKSNMHEINLC